MAEQLLDAQGNPVTTNKEITTSLDKGLEGIELSPIGMAMLDVMITAQILNMYGAQTILKEAPDSIEEINEVVTEAIENMGEFSIEHIKQHLMMSFQIVCTHLAESHAQAIVAEGIAAYKAKLSEEREDENPSEPTEAPFVAADEVSDSDTEESPVDA